ncbi:NfeD family protein [Scrofimicrobium sp. R131]|uniref:NfeD family protein n=1 Tax=Scrofimicrobium appendicitidis TaxID=3079930 RepID=A0AAU7VA09_9ACTO
MVVGWFIAALVLGIIELLSVDLFFLTLAIAAVAGGVAGALGAEIWLQIVVFVVVSILLLIFIRPWAKRHLERSTPQIHTNAQALIGKSAVVTQTLEGSAGRVQLDGSEWSARGEGERVIAAGTQVWVVAIDGATAIVTPDQPQ